MVLGFFVVEEERRKDSVESHDERPCVAVCHLPENDPLGMLHATRCFFVRVKVLSVYFRLSKE
jgi:hypothetical protein